MILALKRRIISRFLQTAQLKYPDKHNLTDIERCLEETTRFCRVRRNTLCEGKVLQLRTDFLKHTPLKDIDFLQAVTSKSEFSKFSGVIFFHEATSALAKAVLTDIHDQAENYGINQAREYSHYFNGRSLVNVPKNENVVIEYSSPTIAKHFHEGHLKSTVIGNFIKNISKLFNKNVTSINYLGDWGVYMGYLVIAYKEYGSWYKLEEEQKDHLDYVFEKIKKAIEKDSGVKIMLPKVEAFMNSIEQGDPKALEIWQKCRDIRVNEYNGMYERLGIDFDVTAAESQYVEQAKQVISMLKEKNLLQVNEETGMQYVDVTEDGDKKPIHANLLKSDGKTVYLTRDVASTLDRFNTYSADRYIYVMDFAEQHYFQKLQRVLKKLRPDQPGRMEFVGFDGIALTSSLEKSLDRARFYIQHTMWHKHSRVEDSKLPDVADYYTVCKFIEDILKQRKSKLIKIDMHAISGGTSLGLSLQFSHARLCSLAAKCNIDYSLSSIDFNLLSEEIAIRLIQHLARYHEVLIQSYVELEACHLVHYLKDLVRLETLAYEELWVLNQPLEIAKARFALFKCIKQVLANGMNILGMKPLESI